MIKKKSKSQTRKDHNSIDWQAILEACKITDSLKDVKPVKLPEQLLLKSEEAESRRKATSKPKAITEADLALDFLDNSSSD